MSKLCEKKQIYWQYLDKCTYSESLSLYHFNNNNCSFLLFFTGLWSSVLRISEIQGNIPELTETFYLIENINPFLLQLGWKAKVDRCFNLTWRWDAGFLHQTHVKPLVFKVKCDLWSLDTHGNVAMPHTALTLIIVKTSSC